MNLRTLDPQALGSIITRRCQHARDTGTPIKATQAADRAIHLHTTGRIRLPQHTTKSAA